MKTSKLSVIIFLTVVLTTLFCSACYKKHYHLKSGTYGFETAIITNKLTSETIEKSFDNIIGNNDDYIKWHNLFSFNVFIDKTTEYFRIKNYRYFVISEGLAFEVIGENKLQLHFPHWSGNDYKIYDIKIILGWQQTYC